MEAHPTPVPAPRPTRRGRRAAASALVAVLASTSVVLLGPSTPASAEYISSASTRLGTRAPDGGPVKGYVEEVALSGNGRFLAFTTSVSLVPQDTNGKIDVYVRDRWAAVTELVSQSSGEQPVAGDSIRPTLSDDGRYVTFVTKAANLIAVDNLGHEDVFVRDRYAGTTTRVTVGVGGALVDNKVERAQISGNGRYVVFSTSASNVVPNDTNVDSDVFVRDLQASTTERVSLNAVDGQSSGGSYNATISDDGRMVAFDCDALLAGGVVGGGQNVYVRDRTAGTTQLVNVKSDEGLPDAGAASPSISGNGRYVVFASAATNLVAGDTNSAYDAFLRDLIGGTTEIVGLADNDSQIAAGTSPVPAGIDDDASHILFSSTGPGNTGTDAGGDYDVFQRTRSDGRTQRISTSATVPDPAANTLFASTDDTGASVAFRTTQKLTTDANFDQGYIKGGSPYGPFPALGDGTDQLYQDFLGRDATSAERADIQNRFLSGEIDLATVVARLAVAPGFASSRAPMVRLYWAFFLRRPDSSGLTYWLGRYQGGTSLTTIAQSFATSSEFKNRYGNVGNQAYVKLVYQNVFERQPDAGGLAFWTGKLDRKEITRGGVIVEFSESSEGKRRLAGPTDITLISLAMLRTVPGPALWAALYPTIDAGEKQSAWIGRQILASTTYAARFS